MRSHLEVHRGIPLRIHAELVVLAGQDGVEDDTHQGGNCQTGQSDGGFACGDDDGASLR